jgi:hypothetical protein
LFWLWSPWHWEGVTSVPHSSIPLSLFFRIITMVERDLPGLQGVTITGVHLHRPYSLLIPFPGG